MVPGSVRPGNPTPPPPTPFQPGAPPLPPLPIPGALVGGLLLGGQVLWGWLNSRPAPITRENPEGNEVRLPGQGNRTITWSAQTLRVSSPTFFFTGGQISPGGVSGPNTIGGTFTGVGIITGKLTGRQQVVLGPDGFTPAQQFMALQALTAAGPGPVLWEIEDGRVESNPFQRTTITDTVFSISISDGTNTAGNTAVSAPPLLPDVAPQIPEALPIPEQTAPVPEVAPLVPLPLAPPVPGVAPAFPRPAPTPGGAPGRAPGRAPGIAPSPGPSPGPSRPPALPQAVPITAGGVQPQLPPAPAATNTGTTFLPGGRPLAPNGPQATMQGIATELGKLEQKLEILLNPDDALSPLELLNKVIDQIENVEFLIEKLLPQGPYEFGAGAYRLAPICDRDSEGNLVEPLEAPWAGGEGELTELRRKLDALALLIQHHKTLRQPTCGPRGSGPHSNVTVHFESD